MPRERIPMNISWTDDELRRWVIEHFATKNKRGSISEHVQEHFRRFRAAAIRKLHKKP